jgi:signal transduction histidine kinase
MTRVLEAEILSALDAGVIVVRGDGVIVRANPCAAGILGRAPGALEGCAIDDFVAPLPALLDAAGLRDRRREVAIDRPNGTSTLLGYSVSACRADCEDPCHVILFQDITGVSQLRRERDRLLQMAALGDALPTLLHELRNPIAAVTAMAEVLVEETEGPIQMDLHALLGELRRINLSLSGLGGAARPLSSRECEVIDATLRESCRVLEPMALRRRITLAWDVPDMPPLPLDRGVLSGVVFNLVTNALDASGPDKTVTLSARREEGVFTLTVEDNGCGMTPEVKAKCCELFFTHKSGGSGVGLALVKRAVDSAGGALVIESAVGRGTKVTLRVPLFTKPPTSGSEMSRPAGSR